MAAEVLPPAAPQGGSFQAEKIQTRRRKKELHSKNELFLALLERRLQILNAMILFHLRIFNVIQFIPLHRDPLQRAHSYEVYE